MDGFIVLTGIVFAVGLLKMCAILYEEGTE